MPHVDAPQHAPTVHPRPALPRGNDTSQAPAMRAIAIPTLALTHIPLEHCSSAAHLRRLCYTWPYMKYDQLECEL